MESDRIPKWAKILGIVLLGCLFAVVAAGTNIGSGVALLGGLGLAF
jgi:hypothetical protein